ncbi:MAG: GNAT family N-acetyltransferase [Bacilli bacterium]|nr:GNAT family N-acetyltransferase [Bacilli bacterium]MDD4282629.1 GNAT family N-acetyltransferase [Bacilli bacterium]MDD4718660.1 GNAT family N-acetyltransferase [Bacilli bacterium]
MYELVNVEIEHIELLKKYKFATILNNSNNISEEEKKQIINYVNKEVPRQLKDYKLIIVNFIIVGCLLVSNYKDGVLLNEIYLEERYRNMKIGSSIINDLIKEHNIIYLWVYKENLKSIKLYKQFRFIIIEKTKTRYLMKYQKNV